MTPACAALAPSSMSYLFCPSTGLAACFRAPSMALAAAAPVLNCCFPLFANGVFAPSILTAASVQPEGWRWRCRRRNGGRAAVDQRRCRWAGAEDVGRVQHAVAVATCTDAAARSELDMWSPRAPGLLACLLARPLVLLGSSSIGPSPRRSGASGSPAGTNHLTVRDTAPGGGGKEEEGGEGGNGDEE